MIKSPVNIGVRLEFVARGEKSVTDLAAMRLAAVVQAHLDIRRCQGTIIVIFLSNFAVFSTSMGYLHLR